VQVEWSVGIVIAFVGDEQQNGAWCSNLRGCVFLVPNKC
jgi:hypothetical protein